MRKATKVLGLALLLAGAVIAGSGARADDYPSAQDHHRSCPIRRAAASTPWRA